MLVKNLAKALLEMYFSAQKIKRYTILYLPITVKAKALILRPVNFIPPTFYSNIHHQHDFVSG